MADTKRTSTDLLTNIFQDGQAAASITAQDLRDLVVSMKSSHADIVLSAVAATTIAVAGTYVKAAGTTVLGAVVEDFDDDGGTSNRLKYIGAPSRRCTIVTTVSLTSASNNQVIGFKIAVNGVVADESVARELLGTGSDITSMTLSHHIDLTNGDYVEVWVTNETSTGSVTVENLHVHVMGFLNG